MRLGTISYAGSRTRVTNEVAATHPMDHAPKRACQAPVEGSASVPGRRRDSTAACRDSIPVSSISGVGRRARTAAPKK